MSKYTHQLFRCNFAFFSVLLVFLIGCGGEGGGVFNSHLSGESIASTNAGGVAFAGAFVPVAGEGANSAPGVSRAPSAADWAVEARHAITNGLLGSGVLSVSSFLPSGEPAAFAVSFAADIFTGDEPVILVAYPKSFNGFPLIYYLGRLKAAAGTSFSGVEFSGAATGLAFIAYETLTLVTDSTIGASYEPAASPLNFAPGRPGTPNISASPALQTGDRLALHLPSSADILSGTAEFSSRPAFQTLSGIVQTPGVARIASAIVIAVDTLRQLSFNLRDAPRENAPRTTRSFVPGPTVNRTDFFSYYINGVSGALFQEGQGYGYNPNRPDEVVNIGTGQVLEVTDGGSTPTVREATPQEMQEAGEATATPDENSEGKEMHFTEILGSDTANRNEILKAAQGMRVASITIVPGDDTEIPVGVPTRFAATVTLNNGNTRSGTTGRWSVESAEPNVGILDPVSGEFIPTNAIITTPCTVSYVEEEQRGSVRIHGVESVVAPVSITIRPVNPTAELRLNGSAAFTAEITLSDGSVPKSLSPILAEEKIWELVFSSPC